MKMVLHNIMNGRRRITVNPPNVCTVADAGIIQLWMRQNDEIIQPKKTTILFIEWAWAADNLMIHKD